ncbi:MAG: CHC2 zinc finger domain-containing protein, partial [Deltaproteobacteria bacterium]|nr:CHC2 zinc finger domain-containing protein [Deltaproteobacteria bacterium]
MSSKQTVEEIRARLSIVDLIGKVIPLKKSGHNFKGICPFHQEKTPSFMVNEEKQIYHCFGCGEGGDIFSFLMKFENVTFPEALQELAKKAGVKLPEQTKGPQKKE